MEWTDIQITVPQRDAPTAEAIATMVSNGGIQIEDYSDLEQEAMEIAHIDLIEQELLDKPRDIVIVHMYLAPDENLAEILPLFRERLDAAGIDYKLETAGVEQEDWQNAWKKYYHAMEIGQRLAIVPSWEQYRTDRTVITMDPGMAFGTGTHETTSLCLETLDRLVAGGERVLDVGTGSGILAIAALKLGAALAEGVDIDPMCVRTAGENAERNGVAQRFRVLVGDLSDKASGTYDIITANIVAAAILSMAPHIPALMKPDARFIASGIIDTRRSEVLEGLKSAGLEPLEVKEKRGWVCIICRRAQGVQ
jgi:ribosomal protein L11 methyltransferase